MDKIKKYQQIIREVLEYESSIPIATAPRLENKLIIDQAEKQFVHLLTGWSGVYHKDSIVYHIEIIGDKVWVHEDNTDINIANVLSEKGIIRSDIILGFVPEIVRGEGGFGKG